MIASVLIGSIILIFAWIIQKFPVQTDPYFIAIVGPLAGEDREHGAAMQETAKLCLDRIKKQGKLKGKRIELLYFNDQNDRRTALKIASQITGDDRILLVIGHFYSMSAEVAGAMYRRRGIPAITASAASDTLTPANEWYFRTIPDNTTISRYTASYIGNVLKKNQVSLIYDKGDYGTSLVRSFKKAIGEMNIEIPHEWSFDKESKEGQRQINTIISELRALKDPGILYFVTQAPEAVQILSYVKYAGTGYTVIGPDTFCSQSFINHFNRHQSERQKKGYFTDGIYAISPFLSEMGGKIAHDFVNEYEVRYSKKPSWVAACYYDAMLMALNAVEKSDIKASVGIQKIRRGLRDRMADYTSTDMAIDGVTGKLFFDRNRNIARPYYLGHYKYQELLPYFTQYTALEGRILSGNKKSKEQGTKEEIIIDNRYHIETHLVYVGLNINEIRHLNIEQKTHDIDFTIWFRFKEAFEKESLIFPDAIGPIDLGAPIIEDSSEVGRLLTYQTRSVFKNDLDFRKYPFDIESLNVRFYDKDQSRSQLIFLPDILQKPLSETDKRELMPSLFGWQISNLKCFETIKTIFLSEKKSAPFSEYTMRVSLKRSEIPALASRFLAPLIVLSGLLYLSFFISGNGYGLPTIIFSVTALISLLYHGLMGRYFSGAEVNMRYGFYMIYALVVLSGVFSLITFFMEKSRVSPVKTRVVRKAGKIGYPIILILGCIALFLAGNS